MSNTPKIGKAKFGSDYVKRKYFKLKDGESGPYRIIPPLGDLADSGKWAMFYRIHYGYRNSKGEMRVFQSPLVTNKEKMVEVPDAALERIEKLKAELEKAKASGNKALTDKLTELVGGQKAMYNLDSNWYVNVKDAQGNIGILKLRHKAKLALEIAIKEVRAENIEPLDVDTGRWFTFTRAGTGPETTFSAKVLQTKKEIPGVGVVKQDVVDVLTPDVLARLGKEAAELDKLFKKPTAEEVKRIVDESDLLTGRSKAVDEILDAKSDSNTNDSGDDGEDEPQSSPTQGGSAPAAQAAPANQPDPALLAALGQTAGSASSAASAPSTPTGAAAANPAPQGAAASPSAAAAQSLAAAPAAANPAPTPAATNTTPKTTAQTVNDMSDEEFLKSLGL